MVVPVQEGDIHQGDGITGIHNLSVDPVLLVVVVDFLHFVCDEVLEKKRKGLHQPKESILVLSYIQHIQNIHVLYTNNVYKTYNNILTFISR